MGSGIAQVAAQAGFHTLLFDMNREALHKAGASITGSMDKLVQKGKITAGEKQNILERIHYTSDIQQCLADVFIEAIIEKPAAKVALFNQLAELNHSDCIFATNTSSLSVTEIAAAVQRPERVIGFHFFNPAPLMKLTEIVCTSYTAAVVLQATVQLAKQMGKLPVVCKDSPGFIVNRVARPYYIEALRLVEEEKSHFAQIDSLLESTGFRMGPFRLMDLIGNDINYAVSCSVYEQMGRPERLKPSAIQKEKVEAGELGRKTGSGYYDYGKPDQPANG